MTSSRRPLTPAQPPQPADVGFQQFVWLWNRSQGLGTPPLHRDIARWLVQRWCADDRRLLLLVFRDAGKSTLVALFCAWLLTRHPDLRILVLAAEHELARKMVRNVKRIVERFPLDLPPDRPARPRRHPVRSDRRRHRLPPPRRASGLGGGPSAGGRRRAVPVLPPVGRLPRGGSPLIRPAACAPSAPPNRGCAGRHLRV